MKLFVLLLEFTLWSIISLLCAITLILSSFYLYLNPDLPPVSTLRETKLQTPLKVFTQDGKLITEFGEKKRIPLALSEVPSTLLDAILAAEDDRFYSHQGVSVKALGRATFDLISTGSIQSGGSTITMQVAKNFFLSRERTFIRKFNEIILALQIENELSKEEILELYVNKIYLGHRAYGFGAAAQVYYGKTLDELTLPEFAMLASLPKSPSKSNPITNPERALGRRDWILNRMLKLSLITQEEHKKAIDTPVVADFHSLNSDIEAFHVAELVRLEMVRLFGQSAYTEGLNVYTTLASENQEQAGKAVRKGLHEYDQRHGYRGPIGKYNINDLDFSDPEKVKTLRKTLKQYPLSGDIQPALIISSDNEKAQAVLQNTSRITLNLDSISWARPYLSVNSLGPSPKNPSDTLNPGDIVYVSPSLTSEVKEKISEPPLDNENENELPLESENSINWSLSQIPRVQGALVSLDPNNGAILALVGGYDYSFSNYNRVTQAERQAGSNIKPFIYAAALENGFTAASIINDAPVVFEDEKLEATWRPENSSGKFFGPTRLRKALYKSRNLVSVRLLREITIPKALGTFKAFGFDTSKLPKDLSLALGSAGITPLEMATGYAVIANGGYLIEPYFIDHITDINGEVIYRANPAIVCRPPCIPEEPPEIPIEETFLETGESDTTEPAANDESFNLPPNEDDLADDAVSPDKQGNIEEMELSETTPAIPKPLPRYAPKVMDERVNYIIHSILKDVITKGTGRKALQLNRSDLAGKTGTTNNQMDAWFSGYNTNLVTTSWVGFDNPETLGAREYGARAALPIWMDYMAFALSGSRLKHLPRPDGLITMRIDPDTGEAAGPGQENAIFETFREEFAPKIQRQNSTNVQSDDIIPEELF